MTILFNIALVIAIILGIFGLFGLVVLIFNIQRYWGYRADALHPDAVRGDYNAARLVRDNK